MATGKFFFVHKHIDESKITASWKWYSQSQGLVQWTFTNPTSVQGSVILMRSGYMFGNAFWPVYEANAEFGTSFASKVEPLVDNGVETNSPPLFVANFGNRYIVCFLFTLAPGQTWSMLEGGFSGIEPTGVTTYDVTDLAQHIVCIGYSPQQVTDWDEQTGEDFQGYSPNPNTFVTLVGNVSAPYIQLFPDPISMGQCTTSKPTDCNRFVTAAVEALQHGDIMVAIDNVIEYFECIGSLAQQTVDIKAKIRNMVSDFVKSL